MDDIVKRALAKWPNVPDCYGWLGLDARGNWYLRDEFAQAQGTFAADAAQAKGSRLEHAKLIEFIGRNYEPDVSGQWFFQNGPQRVYVELEVSPLIWRISEDGSVHDHTGRPALVQSCWLDELGRLYLQSKRGLGLVHTLDMGLAADAVERGAWQPREVSSVELPARFAYVLSPYLLLNK